VKHDDEEKAEECIAFTFFKKIASLDMIK